MRIVRRSDGRVLLELYCDREAQLVQAALREGIALRGCRFPFQMDLTDTDLSGVDFTGSDLEKALFVGAKLAGTCFDDALLSDAVFHNCDLTTTSFVGADLYGVSFLGAQLSPELAARLSVVPAGDVIGWKKCCNDVVVKLRIPAEAKRSNATGRKCRAEYVEVLEVIPEGAVALSLYDDRVQYVKGCIVRCSEPFYEDRWNECASGIHFFLTEEEARAFNLAPWPSRRLLSLPSTSYYAEI
jgi:hypothetical protein